jgi:hypothetical protein
LTEKGASLVELMIALGIGMIITGAIYATYVSQQRSFTAQDRVSEMNSTSKIALDMIVNDIRDTGFGVPDALASFQKIAGCSGINGFVQKISFADNDKSEDQITLVGAYRQAGSLANAVSSGATQIILAGSTGILNDTDRSYISIGGLSFAMVTSISGNALTLNGSTPVDKSYPPGVPVYLVENVTYQVVQGKLQKKRHMAGSGCTTNADTDVIAENIEDLQFEMLDTNGDGITERIRVNILSRAEKPDPDFEGQGNPPSKIENRGHAATNDGYRRRWWQMEVDLRNPL